MPYAKNVEPDHELNRKMAYTCLAIAITGFITIFMLLQSGIGVLQLLLFLIPIFLAYWFSAEIAMYTMGAHVVSPAEAPQLHAIVNRLCYLADMPKPRVAIADAKHLNAFASGRNPSASVVCVTSGLQGALSEEELEAVLSHELAHVAHRDVGVMSLAMAVGALAGLLTRVSLWQATTPRTDDGGHKRNGGEMATLAFAACLTMVSTLLALALSRYREFAADRTGSIITGRPLHLVSALKKIHLAATGEALTDEAPTDEAYNSLLIHPVRSAAGHLPVPRRLSTHPPIPDRIAKLQALEVQLAPRRALGLRWDPSS